MCYVAVFAVLLLVDFLFDIDSCYFDCFSVCLRVLVCCKSVVCEFFLIYLLLSCFVFLFVLWFKIKEIPL